MDNSIYQYAIGEILDGRYFYIPSYQRGYRWTEKQVGDLLRDLLCFANDYANGVKDDKQDQFYCLQPIIARPITDISKLQSIFGRNFNDNMIQKGVWEVIDGQQRLTTIFLLYKYLLEQKGWDAEKLKEEEDNKELYHLLYATREDSSEFLEDIANKIKTSGEDYLKKNVDFYHMANAYKYIAEWIKDDQEGGKSINIRYQLGGSLDNIRASLFKLLNGRCDTKGGSVQVLWYEIAESKEKNNINEFQNINTGTIRLTDAELIKGLFLLKKNFSADDKYIKQAQLALEWEFIENTLHANNFWYFLQKKGVDMPNRIDFVFNLIYKTNKLKGLPESEWDREIKGIDADLGDTRKSVIFRFYYNKFEGKVGEDLQDAITTAWNEVMEMFRTLDDWFCTPSLYNYIGLLSQCGEDLSRIVLFFVSMDDRASRTDFETYLKKRISYHLHGIKIGEDGIISNTYPKDRDVIYKLLLTLNIHILNEQNQIFDSDSDVYKFPFDVLNAQNWDIEHIDSQHTNALKSDNDKNKWIDTAMSDLSDIIREKGILKQIQQMINEKKLDEVIDVLKKTAKEDDADEEMKNSIGNLTLLDASTNRSYGNSLFCTKRRIIIDRIKHGVFVPFATRYVFAKFFDEKGTNRSYWTKEDMESYHKYIYDNLKLYIKTVEG
ncbi:MAG: DUF262 domain-containing protein [Bacteroidales bacterium]|nr:DUF262 domain-containing protein [Bacteroidales bacterium]